MYRTDCPKCGFKVEGNLVVYRADVEGTEEVVYPNAFLTREGFEPKPEGKIRLAKVQCLNCAANFDLEELDLPERERVEEMEAEEAWNIATKKGLSMVTEKMMCWRQEGDEYDYEPIVAVEHLLLELRAYCHSVGIDYKEASDGSYSAYLKLLAEASLNVKRNATAIRRRWNSAAGEDAKQT